MKAGHMKMGHRRDSDFTDRTFNRNQINQMNDS